MSKPTWKKLPSPLPRAWALEPRLMFDAAAVVDAAHKAVEQQVQQHEVADATKHTANETTAAVSAAAVQAAPQLLNLQAEAVPPAARNVLEEALRGASAQVQSFLQQADAAAQLFQRFDGGQAQPSSAWQAAADELLQQVDQGQWQVDVRLASNAQIHGALGAFAAQGPQGRPVIFLNADWLAGGVDTRTLTRVLIEESGHALDARLNGTQDTPGDEGEAFAQVVLGHRLDGVSDARVTTEDDHGVVTIDGIEYAAEYATVSFSQVYVGTPSSLSQEASSLNNITAVTPADGTNFRFVSANPGDAYYSGNNVSGTLEYTDANNVAQKIYGVASRQFKSNGVTNGFFFYAAGADGVIGTGDTGEAAYLLVVNSTKFTAGGSYGTSSDPVDTALNNYLNHYTPVSALADMGTAVESGGLNNATAGSNATGNVLSNDPGSVSRTVTAAGTSTASTAVTTTLASGGTTVTGLYGTLTIGTEGQYSYAVNNGSAAVQALRTTSNTLVDTFTYKVTDAQNTASSTTLKITIQGANDTPVASNDVGTAKVSMLIDGTAYSGTDLIGSKGTGNVLNNDTDVDRYGEIKSIVGVIADGNYVSHTSGGTNTTLTFTSQQGNSLNAVAVGDYAYTPQITTNKHYVLLDSSGATIRITSKVQNADGSYTLGLSSTVAKYNNGSADVNYTLNNGSLVDFATALNNGGKPGGIKEATVGTSTSTSYSTLTVAVSDGYIVAGMTASGVNIPEGAQVTGVSASGGNLTVTLNTLLSSAPSGTITFFGAGGTTLNGTLGTLQLNVDGSYTYTPTASSTGGTSGTEIFKYKMLDAGGLTSTATLTINVQASSSSDPNATNDAVTGTEQGTSAGINPAGNVLSGAITAGTGTGVVDTTPGGTSWGSNPVTSARTAAATSATPIGAGGYIDLTGVFGTLRLNSSGAYTYTVDNANTQVNALNGGDTLTEVFYYTVTNSAGKSDTATLTVTINGANDAPLAGDDTLSAVEDDSVTYSASELLANDSDVDSSSLTIGSVSSGTGGTAVLNPDGTVTFTPTANFNGNASFTYTAFDGAASTTATVTVVVAAVNDYPTAVNNTYSVTETSTLSGKNVITDNDTAAGTDSDTETNTASLSIARINGVFFSANSTNASYPQASGWMEVALSHGTLYAKSDGTIGYVHTPGDVSGDSFTYSVSDGSGGESDSATVRIDVLPINHAPEGTDAVVTLLEDDTKVFAAADFGFSDAQDGNSLAAVKISSLPSAGELRYAGVAITAEQVSSGYEISKADLDAGKLTFVPTVDENGSAYATFTFQVRDTGGTTNGGIDLDATPNTITVNVTPVNDAPTAADDTFTVAEDSGTTALDVLANDGFAPDTGETLTVIAVTQPADGAGTVTLDDGEVHFTPAANFFGTTSFTYTISDGNGGTATATATVTVTAVNDAPTLAHSPLDLTVSEDAGAPVGAVGSLVSTFTGGISDPDAGSPKGIAITATDETHGTWHYSTDGGNHWQAVGPVSAAGALLLADDADTRLYFQPNADFNGTVSNGLSFRAWDRSSGTAGTKVNLAPAIPVADTFTIPDSGAVTPFPSVVTVSGYAGLITNVNVTLSSITHTYPDDLDILLVGPQGQSVLLMSDAGGSGDVNGITLTFDDAAAAGLSDSGQLVSGRFKPS
uniref:tandem-95 repeat protein n=1 Tax=uncultured Azohydromonas sp. TaxID=487342 RepID=UPI00260FD3EF